MKAGKGTHGYNASEIHCRRSCGSSPKHLFRTTFAVLRAGRAGAGFALANGGYYSEHAQIYDVLRKKGVTGLAVVAGDKHSFWASLTSADLPPRAYDPVGVEFVTGSISAQGLVEIGDRVVKPDHACDRRRCDRELGCIAGTRPMGLGRFFARFEEESDGTIGGSETKLPGHCAHLTLPVSHMGLLLSRDVARQVGVFLDSGRFPD